MPQDIEYVEGLLCAETMVEKTTIAAHSINTFFISYTIKIFTETNVVQSECRWSLLTMPSKTTSPTVTPPCGFYCPPGGENLPFLCNFASHHCKTLLQFCKSVSHHCIGRCTTSPLSGLSTNNNNKTMPMNNFANSKKVCIFSYSFSGI